ncbi:hypothetical protein M9H77_19312 [Catharanthus roseus]|uniref:Uncharacterized protein n=1 Tax=Catharanthus roseus TaxID=4058 RepID=A0ACC0BA11_CATRO|nr:hypothetical protein M9H77_19312 [Catharanthus roseus]
MDFEYLTFNLVTFFIFLFFVFLLINGRRKSTRTKTINLPPGPWKLPILGNLHNMMMGSVPHRLLRDLAKKHGDLMLLKLGEFNAIVVSSPRMAKEVLKTHDLSFLNRPIIQAPKILCYDNSDLVFSQYGDSWRQMRKIFVLELLSTKRVRSFQPIRQDEGSRLVSLIKESVGKSIDLSEKINSYTTSMVARAAFGKVNDAGVTFLKLVKEASEVAGGFDPADIFPSYKFLNVFFNSRSKLLKIHGKTDMILEEMIDEHIKNHEMGKKANGENGKEDVIDILLSIKDSGELQFPFQMNNVKALIFDMFAAGTETSSSTVEWAMSELIRNPDVMAKAQNEVRQVLKGKQIVDESVLQELEYLKLIVKEVLRLHPSSPLLIPRECREDCQIDGYDIPVKTRVFVNIWAIARDDKYWKDPESFIPERFENTCFDFTGNNFEYLPFGSGRRMCPGMTFGLANVDLVLALLLYHFNWKLPPGVNDIDMTERVGLGATKKHSLVLIPTLYDPSF